MKDSERVIQYINSKKEISKNEISKNVMNAELATDLVKSIVAKAVRFGYLQFIEHRESKKNHHIKIFKVVKIIPEDFYKEIGKYNKEKEKYFIKVICLNTEKEGVIFKKENSTLITFDSEKVKNVVPRFFPDKLKANALIENIKNKNTKLEKFKFKIVTC